jgi:RNA polymerase sigma factor (sigma-70 family)
MLAYAVARDRDTADDLTQEAFLSAWLKRDTLRDTSLAEPWLARIVRNTAWQWRRAGQTRSRLLPLIPLGEMVVEPMDDSTKNPRQAAQQKETEDQLHTAIMALPDDLREAVLLHNAEGMTISEIARLTGEAPSTISRRLDRANAQLRSFLDSEKALPLASLRPSSASAARAITILTAAAALPATTRAHLLQLASNTPPPPSNPADLSAAKSVAHPEATPVTTLPTQFGFAKLAAVLLISAAAVGGGYVLTGDTYEDDRAGYTETDNERPNVSHAGDRPRIITSKPHALRQQSSRSDFADKDQGLADGDTSPRLSPAQRVAALRNDLISTHPLTTPATPETSGSIALDLQVVNQSGLPVDGATIIMPQYAVDMMATYKMNIGPPPSEQTTFTTNNRGIARVTVPDKYGDFPLTGMTALVSHPDYTSTRADLTFSSITKIVLEHGNRLSVIPVDALTSAPVTDGVSPKFFGIWLEPEWRQQADGTIAITKIAEAKADFVLSYKGPDGRIAISEHQQIQLPVKDKAPITVALNPTYTVRGRLSSNVPRPVNDILLEYAVAPEHWDMDSLQKLAVEKAEVDADGNFALAGIPKNTITYISALGYDYCSAPGQLGNSMFGGQRLILEDPDHVSELPMIQTATVALNVLDRDHNPVVGARVRSLPTICFGGSCRAWGKPHDTTTTEHGIAMLSGLPPSPDNRLSLNIDDFRLVTSDKGIGGSAIKVDYLPGQTTEASITVEPPPAVTPLTKKVSVPEGGTITYTFPPPDK